MKIINNFFLNKSKKGHQNCLLLKTFIEKFVDEKEINIVLNDFSKILDIPLNTLKDKSKQLILNKFNFKTGKFIFNNSKLRILLDYLTFLILILSQIINQKKIDKNKRKNIDIMLDNVTHPDVIYRFKNILNSYENSLIVLKKKINYKKKIFYKSEFLSNRTLIKPSNLLYGKSKIFFIFGYKIFKISINNKFNFFSLVNLILNSSINYSFLFDKYNVKYLLHDRFFTTCPIRNYFLKKKCNGKTASVQVHLAESAISMFVFSETIFTFGHEKNTKDKLIKLGGKINFSHGVGSLKMEHLTDTTAAKDNKDYYSDILIVGINITDWYYTSKITSETYKKYLKLIKNISLMFPKKKIIYKHHSNYKWNKYEHEILSNSNIKIIIDKKKISNKMKYIHNLFIKKISNFFFLFSKSDTKFNNSFHGSYYYLMNSNFIISFGSTMVLEAIGKNKNAFFINPESAENPYFEELDYLKKYIINDLESLNEKILRNEKNELSKSDIEDVCINDSPSNMICNYINNQKTNN